MENTNFPEFYQLNNNYQLIDYRSLQKGIHSLESLKNYNTSFVYYYYNDEKRYSINSNITYTKSKTIVNNTTQLTKDLVFNNYVISQGGDNYNFNINIVNYFRKLKIASKIETNNSWNINPISVNSADFFISKNFISNIKCSATTYFKTKINFDFGASYNFFRSNFQEITSTNNTKDFFININYKFSKTFILENNNSLYIINGQKYSFNNLILTYNPDEKKVSYRLLINNMLNEKDYTTISLGNYTSSIYKINLVPRYILLNVKYRF